MVAQVGAALGRGHALFSPAPTDAGASLRASADTFDAVSRKMTDTSTQMLDTKGRFGAAYGDMAQRFSSRFAASGGQDRTIAGLASEAADADGAGRTQTGNVVNGAVSDTNRNAPYSNTVAGQNALLTDLRDRVDQQRKVIAAYKNLVGQLAARARAQGGRGGGRGMGAGSGLGQMFGGLGGGQSRGGGGSGGGGMGGFSPASLTGLLKPALDTNSSTGPGGIGQFGVANDPDSGLGAPVARAALSKQGAPYVWGAKGPNVFDCSGLTQWAWKQVGVSLGPDTYTQMNQGRPVPAGQVRAGDLIFPSFSKDSRGYGHVMLAISPTQVVHAPQSGDVVRVTSLPSSYMARRPG